MDASARSAYQPLTLNIRAVAETQTKHGLSLFHAKNAKKTIAAWRSDLTKVLRVFTVRSIISPPTSLIMGQRDRTDHPTVLQKT